MTNTLSGSSFFWNSLSNAAKEVLAQIAGCTVEVQVSAPVDVPSSALEVSCLAEGALAGSFCLRYPACSVGVAAALLTGEDPGNNELPTDDEREATVELSNQICGNLAIALRARYGALELRIGKPTEFTEIESQELCVQIGERRFAFYVALSKDFSQSLDQNERSLSQPLTAPQVPPVSSEDKSNRVSGNGGGILSKVHDTNLALLLDIELPVTMRFGCREMLLKEVLELTSGSVVELDRRVREPVDLLIEDKLIARGEVVLVEGNYGLRVLEVANERDRLSCLP